MQIPKSQFTLPIKCEPHSVQGIEQQQPNKLTTIRSPSRIPKLITSQVANSASVTKTQSAYQARRTYDAKVAAKRKILVSRGQISSVKHKPLPDTSHLNVAKSIRTPVPVYKRPGYVQDEEQIQKNRFKSLILRQAEENRRIQDKMQQEHQGLIATMMNDLNNAVEISNDYKSLEKALHLDSSTSSDPSQNWSDNTEMRFQNY